MEKNSPWELGINPDTPSIIELKGRVDAAACAALWDRAAALGKKRPPGEAGILDLSGVTYLDTAGTMLIRRILDRAGTPAPVPRGLPREFSNILNQNIQPPPTPPHPDPPMGRVARTGRALANTLKDWGEMISFMGEMTWITLTSLVRPGSIRWKETLMVAERSGVDALPIVALISFIVGLVMAFQSAVPMKMFGAELYVANLIGMAMVRELGPLMTAIVLAGRSASAFAAEIGTMKINEELDALTVMGLDPMRFLILPRVIASTLVTPLLTVFANLMGILGGAVVILSFDYPLVAYYNQVAGFVTWMDFTGGLVKCFIFGILIATTGCMRGYHTGRGPSAVGASTTSAVVTCIILIAIFDAVFSIIYYSLGI
ncbi:MAG: MlaE family lipid ABC transporter permease subunit [Desulfobacterales bacterium]|nr:MlaE family lipid ABC transporter permease subunit [Desulfobacterales bacterium]